MTHVPPEISDRTGWYWASLWATPLSWDSWNKWVGKSGTMRSTLTNKGCHEKQQSEGEDGTALRVLQFPVQTPNIACYGITECKLSTPPQSLPDFLSPHQGVSYSPYAFFTSFCVVIFSSIELKGKECQPQQNSREFPYCQNRISQQLWGLSSDWIKEGGREEVYRQASGDHSCRGALDSGESFPIPI